jgi:thioesterase domain-containing protein
MANQDSFQPTEVWTPHTEDHRFDSIIEDARGRMNSKNPDQLIHELRQSVHHSAEDIVYAILEGDGTEAYSKSDALVMFNPFANAATDNMLIRAEFIREAAKSANIRDDAGDLKPVIMLASPGVSGSHLNLNREDKHQIRHGDLGPAAKELLGAVAAQKYGSVALLGFSQGADMAIAGARSAYSANLDVAALGVGDPAGVKNRHWSMLAANFLASSGQFDESIKSGGIDAQERVIGKNMLSINRNQDFARFAAGAFVPPNASLWLALSRNSFEKNMEEALENNEVKRFVVGYGEKSHIARQESIEPSLARLHDLVASADNRLISIRVDGKDHPWGDQLPLLARLCLEAVS